MIYLFTGSPGSGKTLRAIWYLMTMPKEHAWRPIYSNITDLKLPDREVHPLPDSWQTCPKGSIFVMDEAQRIWPASGKQGLSTKPDVLALDEHRHGGYDFYLITQHPTLLDSTVRKFVTMHEHLVRASGREMVRVFSKNRVFEVGDARELKAAESAFWKYPKEYYGYYKSADVHVVRKFKLPWGLRLLLFFLATAILYVGYHLFTNKGLVKTANVASNEMSEQVKGASEKAQDYIDVDKAETPGLQPEHYISRIPDRPETAPLYDGLRVPTQFPVIVGCITYKEHYQEETCNCYTQQGTIVEEVSHNECKIMVAKRRFQPYMDAITPTESVGAQNADSGQDPGAQESPPLNLSAPNVAFVP